MCCFFFGMNLLEMKPVAEGAEEVKQKFWPTYKVRYICRYVDIHMYDRTKNLLNFGLDILIGQGYREITT